MYSVCSRLNLAGVNTLEVWRVATGGGGEGGGGAGGGRQQNGGSSGVRIPPVNRQGLQAIHRAREPRSHMSCTHPSVTPSHTRVTPSPRCSSPQEVVEAEPQQDALHCQQDAQGATVEVQAAQVHHADDHLGVGGQGEEGGGGRQAGWVGGGKESLQSRGGCIMLS